MNKKRLREIIRHIEANPETWRQQTWHCGTSHCVAGFAELGAAGYSLNSKFDFDKFERVFHTLRPLKKSVARKMWNTLMGKFYKKSNLGTVSTSRVARGYLDLSSSEANYLFSACRTLRELQEFARTGKTPSVW